MALCMASAGMVIVVTVGLAGVGMISMAQGLVAISSTWGSVVC